MNTDPDQKSGKRRRDRMAIAAAVFLAMAYGYILWMVADPQTGWILPEAFVYKSYVMQQVPLNASSIVRGTFDTASFDGGNRNTRPLANTFEIFDTHFRSWLWQYCEPVPSLSLTFLFSLILGPWIFYRLLRNLGIRPSIALFGVAIMLLNPGSLSLVVMLFRPAKALMNFWLITSLFLASLIQAQNEGAKPKRRLPLNLMLGASIFLALLCDETGVVIPLAILVLFPSVFLRDRRTILGYLLVPAVLGVLYLQIFPMISARLGFGTPDVFYYPPVAKHPFPGADVMLGNLLTHLEVITQESVGLFDPRSMPQAWQQVLMLLLAMALVVFVHRAMSWQQKPAVNFALLRSSLWVRTLLVILILCIFHTILMEIVGNAQKGRVWGPYWYGAYFGIFWGLLIAAVGEAVARAKGEVPCSFGAMAGFICLALMTVFPYTNFTYRRFHYYPYSPSKIEQMYRGNVNRFEDYNPAIFADQQAINALWRTTGAGVVPASVRKELYWIPIEMGVVKALPIPSARTVLVKYRTLDDYPIPLQKPGEDGHGW
jgi:hypothetical protein